MRGRRVEPPAWLYTLLALAMAAAFSWDLIKLVRLRRVTRLDTGLLRGGYDVPRTLYEWAGIQLAYGSKLSLVHVLASLVFHVAVVLILATHLPHLAAILGLPWRPPTPIALGSQFSKVVGVLAAASLAMMLVLRLHPRRISLLRAVVGHGVWRLASITAFSITLLATITTGVLGSSVLHSWLAVATMAFSLPPGVRHFLLLAWARPLLAFARSRTTRPLSEIGL